MNKKQIAEKIFRDTGITVEIIGHQSYRVAGAIVVTTLNRAKAVALAVKNGDPYYTDRINRALNKNPKTIKRHPKSCGCYRCSDTAIRKATRPRLLPLKKVFSHTRGNNPRLPSRYVLTAQIHGGPLLRYIGGVRFSTKGRAALFSSPNDALRVGRELKKQFAVLQPYRLFVRR